jgi:pyruvate,water dikinase
MTTPAPSRISSPADFPVTWDDPRDADLSWRWERWHAPEALTPLAFEMIKVQMAGMRRGARAVGRPFGIDGRLINSYYYFTLRPLTDADPGPLETVEQPTEPDANPWAELWLPRVQAFLARWEAFDRDNADLPAMQRHFEESLLWFERCWEIHVRLAQRLDWDAWCQRVLGWGAEEARELATGLPNKSLEGDALLRQVADSIRESEALTDAFSRPAGEVLASLPSTPEGAQLRASLDEYLDRFGRRSDNFIDVSLATWREDPTPVISLLKMYALQPKGEFEAEQAALRQRREALLERARAEIREHQPALQEEFERELAAGRRRSQVMEDHNYWLDQQTYQWMRLDCLAAGRLLAEAGLIGNPDEVFFLTLDEVRAALRGSSESFAEQVADRRANWEHRRRITPPMELGMPLADEFAAFADLLFGGVRDSSEGDQLRGQPASPGVTTGRARVIKSLAEADRLSTGEVLVARTTTPPWTPLFGVAGAIVTDAGGALSHAAVVAREYGIPAVVGTTNATARIQDGQLIRVDGTAGTVDLLAGE